MEAMFKRIDHIGVVVEDLDASLKTYVDALGFTLLERMTIPEQRVEAAFLDAHNGALELIAPTDRGEAEESGTARFLRKRGEGPHHVCLEVDDIDAALTELRKRGVRLIDETPRQGVHGRVAFIHPKASHGMMIELLEKDDRIRSEL
jgi:methylmalonyl-CoA/ethylmalonyl-CoA epimerase